MFYAAGRMKGCKIEDQEQTYSIAEGKAIKNKRAECLSHIRIVLQ